MCENFNLEPSKEFKAVFSLYVTPDKLSGLVDDVGIVKQEDLDISLAQKVDKVEGKSLVEDTEIQRLSTLENYNDSQIKQDISTIKSNLNTKVDKVDGKQLSTNDFTDTLKSKLDSVDAKSKVYSVNGKTGDVKINEYTLPVASTTTLGGVKVDGTTITINNGVISSSGGSGETGTTNYNDLLNKPQINGVELSGNKTLDNLGIQAKGDYALKSNIPTKISQLTNDSGFLTAHQDISNLATKSELNNKVDKVSGKQLSTNDFTTTLKNKLDSVDVNAKVYSVNGQTGVVTIDVPDISILTPKVVEDSTSTTATISKAEANTTYKYGTLTSLTVTEVENSPLPITVIFTTATSSPTINLPATLESINLADGFEAEKKYVLAIENNIAVIGSIE